MHLELMADEIQKEIDQMEEGNLRKRVMLKTQLKFVMHSKF